MDMGTIIVAIVCNFIAAVILISSICTAASNSWKLALTRFILAAAGGVGIYFAVPALSDVILKISIGEELFVADLATKLGISLLSFNSILYTLMFLIWYGIVSMICSIARSCMISSFKNKTENKAKIKRAKSINPSAEKLAKKAAKREMIAKYRKSENWGKHLFGAFLGLINGVILGLLVLMPFGYIGEDLNKANNNTMSYLEKGFDYTLNGLIDEKIDFKVFDWLVSAQEVAEEPEVPAEE